jgi:hypothetical protein
VPPPSGKKKPVALFAVIGLVVVAAIVAAVLVVAKKDDKDSSSPAVTATADGQAIPTHGKVPSSAPSKQWTKKLQCNDTCHIATDGDKVFASQVKGGKRFLEAFDASDGSSVWKNTKAESGDYGLYLQTYSGLLFASSSTDNTETLTAYDPATGKKEWSVPGSWDGLVSGDSIVVETRDSGDPSTTAVNISDGKKEWTTKGHAVGACSGHVLLAGDGVDVVSATTGKKEWAVKGGAEGSDVTCTPEALYSKVDDKVTAYDLASGSKKWATSLDSIDTIAAVEGYVIARLDADFVGLAAADGKKLWTTKRPKGDSDFGSFALKVSDEKAVLGGRRDQLIDLASGVLGKRSPFAADESALGDDAIVLEKDGKAVAIEITTFRTIWKGILGKHIDGLDVGKGRVFVEADDSVTAYS